MLAHTKDTHDKRRKTMGSISFSNLQHSHGPTAESYFSTKERFTRDDSGLQLEALCYADGKELPVLTEDPKEMQLGLDVVHDLRSNRYEIKF